MKETPTKYGSYLVCKEHIKNVSNFLGQFLEEIKDGYTHDEWITFKIPEGDFLLNLMRGDEQEITQNFTIEIYFDTLKELEKFAEKHNGKVESFEANKAETKYRYHYVELLGPENICKVEASFSENL